MSPATIAEWATLYAAGASLRTIAAEHGVTHKAVRYQLRRAGVQMRPRGCAANPPPVQQPWIVTACLDCGTERRVSQSGYCWHCSRPGTTPTYAPSRTM